jgi:hypothetical protein
MKNKESRVAYPPSRIFMGPSKTHKNKPVMVINKIITI